jgi:hypothetical protein
LEGVVSCILSLPLHAIDSLTCMLITLFMSTLICMECNVHIHKGYLLKNIWRQQSWSQFEFYLFFKILVHFDDIFLSFLLHNLALLGYFPEHKAKQLHNWIDFFFSSGKLTTNHLKKNQAMTMVVFCLLARSLVLHPIC